MRRPLFTLGLLSLSVPALAAPAASAAPLAPSGSELAAAPQLRWHRGIASHYGVDDGLLGSALACGGRLTRTRPVVAHRTLPCGTHLRICRGLRCIVAVVGDRGPFVSGRVLDLGPRVARALRFVPVGVGSVRYAVVRT